jgi:two-component system alkaline phosphatase synthesis response regulator PhoP/two-component system response regulator VicR
VSNRVLVIDDDQAICDLLAKVLSRKGYELKTALTGETGLAELSAFEPDLLIVDKMLPEMHGSEVIAQARIKRPFLGVILITAFPEPFSLGPDRLDAYLAKPFKNLRLIEETVQKALESAAEAKRRDELKSKLAQVVADLTPGAKRRA